MNPEFMNGRKSANNAVAIDVAIIKRPSHEEGGGVKRCSNTARHWRGFRVLLLREFENQDQ